MTTDRVEIVSFKVGTRQVMGTDHPIFNQIHREGKRDYVCTYHLCNGTPAGYRRAQSLAQAYRILNAWESRHYLDQS